MDSLRSSPHIQSLTLCLEDIGLLYILPDDLFGGKVPIRHLQLLVGNGHTVAPFWLLRGVTHFTSSETLELSGLLNVLRNMPALVYFEFLGRLSASNKRGISSIQMPQLMDPTVCTHSTKEFTLLSQLLFAACGCEETDGAACGFVS